MGFRFRTATKVRFRGITLILPLIYIFWAMLVYVWPGTPKYMTMYVPNGSNDV